VGEQQEELYALSKGFFCIMVFQKHK